MGRAIRRSPFLERLAPASEFLKAWASAGLFPALRPAPGHTPEPVAIAATWLPADPRTFLTGAGFAIPDTAMTFKLLVRLTTGNESGSDPITVTRPL